MPGLKILLSLNFYSHAPCGARPSWNASFVGDAYISTHTPLAGRDQYRTPCGYILNHFYSHAPCGARQLRLCPFSYIFFYFYSHAPCGARPGAALNVHAAFYFYSHAPCGARHIFTTIHQFPKHFYSHAPCGARLEHCMKEIAKFKFLLTRPLRGATEGGDRGKKRR